MKSKKLEATHVRKHKSKKVTLKHPSPSFPSDPKMKKFLGYSSRWVGTRFAKLPKSELGKRLTRNNTISAWTKKLSYCEKDSDLMKLVRSIGSQNLCLVWNRKSGVTMGDEHESHKQVKELVKEYGGKQVFGWYLTSAYSDPYSNYPSGRYCFRYHSVWKNPWDEQLVNVTPHPQPWIIFLPDPSRWYDFVRNMGFNARVLFGKSYKLPWNNLDWPVRLVDPNLESKSSRYFGSQTFGALKKRHPASRSPQKGVVYYKGAENYYSPYPFHERCLTERNLLKYLTDPRYQRKAGRFIPPHVFQNPHTPTSRAWMAMHLGEVPVR